MLSFKQFIIETFLSIGLNPNHEIHRENHRQEIHDMIKNAYAEIGGYGGLAHNPKLESKSIHDDISNSIIKAIKRNGRISAVVLYKSSFGRKSIASATDQTPQGKKDFIKIKFEDNDKKRAWGEVSGKVASHAEKLGYPKIPVETVSKLLSKPIQPDKDGYHYTRKIGDKLHKKISVGHPKL